MNILPTILSLVPFLVFIYFIFIKKSTLLKSSVITLVFYILLAIFYWKILPSSLYASFGKGLFVATDIFIIVFGAILFLEILKSRNIIKNISYYLSHLSRDYRIQTIIIAWFFGALLEGVAGFGTPAAIAAPFLMGVGLSPLTSLTIGLLGNSSPGIFGAAGTPIRIGLSTLPFEGVPYFAALLNMVGIIIPVFMIWIITRNRPNKNKEFWSTVPFALWSGFLFLGPSFLIAKYIGQEFPTIMGSILGIILIFISIKLKIFIPKEPISLSSDELEKPPMTAMDSFLPYIILVLMLIVGKFTLGNINIPIGLGFLHNFNVFNPGLIFIAVSIFIAIWKKIKISSTHFKNASLGAVIPFLVISSMLIVSQIMINAGINSSGLPSPINLLANSIKNNAILVFAPLAGAFGSFMTGSITTSNALLGNLFYTASLSVGISFKIVLALLVVGGGIGNMIAMTDILTAEAVIGEKNKEREIIKKLIIPCLICLALVILLGSVLLKWYN